MSSYLNIYLKLKDSDEKRLLKSYGRSSEMYELIVDIFNPKTSYDEKDCTELTSNDFADMRYEVEKRLKSYAETNKMDEEKFKNTSQILSETLTNTIIRNGKHKNLNKDIINNFRMEIEEAWDETHKIDNSYEDDLKETLNEIINLENLLAEFNLGFGGFDGIYFCLT